MVVPALTNTADLIRRTAMPASKSTLSIRLGQVFGYWTVIEDATTIKNSRTVRQWICKCRCGNIATVLAANLAQGLSSSCGCKRSETHRAKSHGKVGSKAYNSWSNIKSRTKNPNNPNYWRYGGAGILLDPSWESFEVFYRDMGDPAGFDDSIDRIDNTKGYNKENCRWASKTEQARNQKSNVNITYGGETHCISEWAELIGIKENTLRDRICRQGWSVERALTTPVRKPRKPKASQPKKPTPRLSPRYRARLQKSVGPS
jgi:hypothetical protein